MNSTKTDFFIAACGDILLADFFFDIGNGMGSQIVKLGVDFIFDDVYLLLQDCDLLVGNLESPISTSSNLSGLRKREFLANPIVVEGLVKAGFDVLGIANNHISQHGEAAFLDTVHLLEEKGILTPGVIGSNRDEQILSTRMVKDTLVGTLAYSLVEDQYKTSTRHYAYQPKVVRLLNQIAKQRQECDFLIVMLHWGEEFVNRPTEDQISLAHKMVDAGCDLILGSHSHVIQGIETYKGKTIAYSLGNFVFSMKWKPARASMLLKVRVSVDGSQSFKITPIWINNKFCPTVARGVNREYVANHINLANASIFEELPSDLAYNDLVCDALESYRRATRKAFIRNMANQPPLVMLQLVMEYIFRKIL